MKKTTVYLIFIFFLGCFLRFYRLGDIPIGFHKDEAFLAYNAYSILKTGKDISGTMLPLHLASFLYSPALYSYFSIPWEALFGLSSFSARFASALFGSLTILTTFFLTLEIFKRNKYRNFLALLSAFLLAVSPWHINLSRTVTENTIVVFFITLGVLSYLLWISKKKLHFLILSFLFFSTTFLIYQAPRAFLPIFVPFLILLCIGKKLMRRELMWNCSLLFLTILLPLLFIFSSKELTLRVRTLNIFSTSETQLTIDQLIREDGVANSPRIIVRTFHNKLVGYSSQFLENYFSHFTFDFLFTDKGLPDRYRIPSSGLLYITELPFLLYGLFCIFKKKKPEEILLIGWLFIAPIGSALTFDDIPNLQRMLIAFPSLQLIISLGFVEAFVNIQKRSRLVKSFLTVTGVSLLFGISFYLHQYYVHSLVYRPWYRNDGYKNLISAVNNELPRFKKVIATNRESAPSIFFLFYGKYDPARFQREKQNNMRDYDRINFGKYEFSQEECPLKTDKEKGITGEKNVLYVNSGLCKVPDNATVLANINRTDNSLVFRILTVR